MIVFKDVENVAKLTLSGQNIFTILKSLNISPLEFFTFIAENHQAKKMFDASRLILIEKHISDIIPSIKEARNSFELDKAIAVNKASQWMAEKLNPNQYGNRTYIEEHKTIDVRAVISRARSRAFKHVDSVVIEDKSVESIKDSALMDAVDSDDFEAELLSDLGLRGVGGPKI